MNIQENKMKNIIYKVNINKKNTPLLGRECCYLSVFVLDHRLMVANLVCARKFVVCDSGIGVAEGQITLLEVVSDSLIQLIGGAADKSCIVSNNFCHN